MSDQCAQQPTLGLSVVSLFSGVGGLDLGLEQAGHRLVAMCESWEPARRVLRDRFPECPVADDVRTFSPAPGFHVLAAGFPCTDLSHAGTKTGIFGAKSGLVEHVFRIAQSANPEWIVLENVPNLLGLHAGAGMRHVVCELERLGYHWAYRTVDSRFTGVPQRRPRVIVLASKSHRPEARLLAEDVGERSDYSNAEAWGFYWTEGRNGLGLVEGAIPTLKGGSTLGLPSAPAVWFPGAKPGHRFVLPRVEDGEALQGFDRGWTSSAVVTGETDHRWKLIGNAVSVGVGRWVGQCLTSSGTDSPRARVPLDRQTRWPRSGWGGDGYAWASHVSAWPARADYQPLHEVVDPELATTLSHRATTGFLSRLDESGRKVNHDFYADLENHQDCTRPELPTRLRAKSWATSVGTRRRMQAQRQRDTKPEVRLRRELHRLGLRYRLQLRPDPNLRSRMDIVFPGAMLAIDVRGCFWHGCPKHGTSPRANAERWAAKLERTVERDKETVDSLTKLGWDVIVVWEHDDHEEMAARIAQRVRARTGEAMRRRTNIKTAEGRTSASARKVTG